MHVIQGIKCEKDDIVVELTRRKWLLVPRHILRTEIGNMFWMPDEKKKMGRPEKPGYELSVVNNRSFKHLMQVYLVLLRYWISML